MRFVGVLAFAFALVGCPSAHTKPSAPAPSTNAAPSCTQDFGSQASFALDRASLAGKPGSAALLKKLDGSAYKYFRALGPQYALRTCAAFSDVRWHLPMAAIHGDAHVEQFVVTPTTAGLEDFDQASFGPAVVDLVRYAASVHLACREVSWSCHADAVVAAYFDAYKEALTRAPQRKEPAVVGRIRKKTPREPKAWLAWADGLMIPLAAAEEARARRGWIDFRAVLAEVRPERPAAYYDIVRMGSLQMGIGSALETKLLLRLRGDTDAPDDDVIVEARSSVPAVAHECSAHPLHAGTLWPLLFMSILGPRMPDVFGYATLADDPAPEFWVQSWVPGYRELALADVESEGELVELARDAALQLAGHFWTRFPEPLHAVQQNAQLRAFTLVNERARAKARDFAEETVREWTRFQNAAR